MSVREFSQATEILALLERGDLAADLSVEIRKVISDLQERAGQKGKASGHVTLRLDMTIEDGVKLEVRGKIDAAAAGGVTFIVMMPDTEPAIDDIALVDDINALLCLRNSGAEADAGQQSQKKRFLGVVDHEMFPVKKI